MTARTNARIAGVVRVSALLSLLQGFSAVGLAGWLIVKGVRG